METIFYKHAIPPGLFFPGIYQYQKLIQAFLHQPYPPKLCSPKNSNPSALIFIQNKKLCQNQIKQPGQQFKRHALRKHRS
jgi:hypothetical protein